MPKILSHRVLKPTPYFAGDMGGNVVVPSTNLLKNEALQTSALKEESPPVNFYTFDPGQKWNRVSQLGVSEKISKMRKKDDKAFVDKFVNSQNSIVKMINTTFKKLKQKCDEDEAKQKIHHVKQRSVQQRDQIMYKQTLMKDKAICFSPINSEKKRDTDHTFNQAKKFLSSQLKTKILNDIRSGNPNDKYATIFHNQEIRRMSNHTSSNVSYEGSPIAKMDKYCKENTSVKYNVVVNPKQLKQKLEKASRQRHSGSSSPLRNRVLNPNLPTDTVSQNSNRLMNTISEYKSNKRLSHVSSDASFIKPITPMSAERESTTKLSK